MTAQGVERHFSKSPTTREGVLGEVLTRGRVQWFRVPCVLESGTVAQLRLVQRHHGFGGTSEVGPSNDKWCAVLGNVDYFCDMWMDRGGVVVVTCVQLSVHIYGSQHHPIQKVD